ncbi:MAG: Uma2 family endonuclease [Microcystaceae cyanobacterium]
MIVTLARPTTLEEFWNWYPNYGGRYELHNGAIVEMRPTGSHEQVISFLNITVINQPNLTNEPFWQNRSTLTQGKTIPLVVEVVGSNWGYDYGHKLIDYEALGIKEYWIIDYLGLGGKRYIGNPKRPTISIYQLVDEEYQLQQFRGNEGLKSAIFPDLNLKAQQIFDSAS